MMLITDEEWQEGACPLSFLSLSLSLAFLTEVLAGLLRVRPDFPVQRALMDGGSCEATPFAIHGHRVAGLCLPLGNYHNIGPRRRPAAEYVAVADLVHLVDFASAAARAWPSCSWDRMDREQKAWLNAIERGAPRRLAPSRNRKAHARATRPGGGR